MPILAHSCKRCRGKHSNTGICLPCLTGDPPFDALYALYSYQYPVTRLILTLKFNEALLYGKILGDLFADHIPQWYQNTPLPEVIIPVPLHAKRLQERGFNQAHEIAKPIARRFRLALDTESCLRMKSTIAQAKLTACERQKNLHQAFQVNRDFSQKTIAILDDVITTGHTITELATALKKSGAKRVDIWSLARAIL